MTQVAGLDQFIRVYDDVLTPQLCKSLAQSFEKAAQFQRRNGAGVAEGLDESGWSEINITALSEPALQQHFQRLMLKYLAVYNDSLGLSRPISPLMRTADLMMKRYRPESNDQFQIHFDSIRQHANRYLVFLWYVNTVDTGGETWFPDIDVRIKPVAGRLIVFPPYWMFQHAGLPPVSGEKYIISSYALYEIPVLDNSVR
jgi:hypothetical protein